MSTSSKASNSIKTKVTLDGITRIVPFTPFLSWLEFEELAGQLFNHPNKSFSATYYDSDGDLIVIDRQEEFEDYLENNIGSKLILKVGQDKDNIDWTVVKQLDELSITSPSQADQDEEEDRSRTSVDPVSSSLLQRFFPNYQSHKSGAENEQQDQIFQEILQRSQKALMELETPSNASAHSRDISGSPSLNTSEHSVPQKFSLENVRDINQPAQSQFSESNPNEGESNVEEKLLSPQFNPSHPSSEFSYHSNSDNAKSSLENISSNSTTISPPHNNSDSQVSNSIPEAPLQTLERTLPHDFSTSSSYQPETETHQPPSPRLTSSLDDYPITNSIQHIDHDTESITEEEFSSPRSNSPTSEIISNPFLDVIEEDDEMVNSSERAPDVCYPPYPDFSNDPKLIAIEEDQTNSVPSLIAICPPHPGFSSNESYTSNNEEEQYLSQSSQPYIAICPPHPSCILKQEFIQPDNDEPLIEELSKDRELNEDLEEPKQETELNANSNISPPPPISYPICTLPRAMPSPHTESNEAPIENQGNEPIHSSEEQPIQNSANTPIDHSSDRALENITRVSRLFDQYRACIPNDIPVTMLVDILIDQIVSGVQIDTDVLEVSLQNISGQSYYSSNTPQRAFMDSLNSFFRHFGTSLNQFMDQFNNNLNTNANPSNSNENNNTRSTNQEEQVGEKSTQEASEAPSIPFPDVPQHQPSNSPPHYHPPPCVRNEPIHWPNVPHQFPPLHRPPFHRPPNVPPHHHHHHHHHPPPPPPPHHPGSHPHPPPPPHAPGPHPHLPGSFPHPHFSHHRGQHFNHHFKHHSRRSSNDSNENNDSANADLSSPERLRHHRCHKKHRNYRQHRNTSADSSQQETKSEASASSSTIIINKSPKNDDIADSLLPMREELNNNMHPAEGLVESDNEIEVEVFIPPRRSHTYSYSQSELKAHNTEESTQTKDDSNVDEKYRKMLDQVRILNDMGFHNDRLNRQLLEEFEGDLQQTVNHLLITGNIPE